MRRGRIVWMGRVLVLACQTWLVTRIYSSVMTGRTPFGRLEVRGVVWRSSHGTHSNLEGLSLWRDGQGRLIASMVSDDNFSPLLPTTLVEVVLE